MVIYKTNIKITKASKLITGFCHNLHVNRRQVTFH